MRVLRGLKHQGVRRKQRRIPGSTEGKNVQNGFRLHRNAHLGLCIERTLQAAYVKVDFHAQNVPVAFSISKMLGEKGRTPKLSGGPQPTDPRTGTKPALWAVSSSGLLCAPATDYQEGALLIGM